MKYKFQITVECEERKIARHTQEVEFTEVKVKENDYGNKTYLDVTVDGRDHAFVDVRYARKPIKDMCVEYLKDYWGENLKNYDLISISSEVKIDA